MEEPQKISAEEMHNLVIPQNFTAPSTVSELLEKYCKADDDVIIIEEILQHIGRHLPQSPQRDENNEVMIAGLHNYFEAAIDKIRFHGKQQDSAIIRDQYGNIIESMMQFFSGSFKYTYQNPLTNSRYKPTARIYEFSLDAERKLSIFHVDQ